MNVRRLGIVLALAAGALVLFLWPKAKVSPEAEVRALVAACVAGVESRDLSALNDALAESFKGPSGMGRQEVKALIAQQALRGGEAVAVLNPTLDVSVDSPDSVRIDGRFFFMRSKVKTVEEGSVAAAYRIQASLEKRDGKWFFVSARYEQL